MSSTARNWTCLARSRMEIEILIFDFGKCGGILSILRLNLIQQCARHAGRASCIAYNLIPCHIAIQLGQKDWQIFDQFLTFNRRKHPNRSFDFVRSNLIFAGEEVSVCEDDGQSNTGAIHFGN